MVLPRLVTFDALHTLVRPRLPVYAQYSQTFEPYLGVLPPDALKRSFKISLKQLQTEKPAYVIDGGANEWWSEVVKRTALGAGADAKAVDATLPEIVPKLLKRFSSREGYVLFDDASPILNRLRDLKIPAALISNADSRMRAVLADLGVLVLLSPVILSEELKIEKPSSKIFLEALKSFPTIRPEECLHIGDELLADYRGARSTGFSALLLRRPSPLGDGEAKEDGEDLTDVRVVTTLEDILSVLEY